MPLFSQLNPLNFTLEKFMDYLYPEIFSVFVNNNPALQQRANFYKSFFSNYNVKSLIDLKHREILQVLEIGSGTGKGSSNNMRILEKAGNFGVNYVAIDKRKKLVDMTKNNLLSIPKKPTSSVAAYVRDGLHQITHHDLRSLGFNGGKVHIYFAEHSIYTELYDSDKTFTYLKQLKEIISDCGLIFIVVQTEHAEIQKLAERNIGLRSNHTQHIFNLENAIQGLNYTTLTRYINFANLTFPRLSNLDWSSIKSRDSDLSCYANTNVETTLKLMTFIKKPPVFLEDTELTNYVDFLQKYLHMNNSKISIDEYIYALRPHNCSIASLDQPATITQTNLHKEPMALESKSMTHPKQIFSENLISSDVKTVMESTINGAKHGVLRGSAKVVSVMLEKKGVSKTKAILAGKAIYYGSFFFEKIFSHSPKVAESEASLHIIYQAALETGRLCLLDVALTSLEHLLIWLGHVANKSDWGNLFKLLSSGITCLQYGILTNHAVKNGILTTTASIAAGIVSEKTIESLGMRL